MFTDTTLTGNTFWMTSKFYNSIDGSIIDFTNSGLTTTQEVIEYRDMYYKVIIDRSDYSYEVYRYDGTQGSLVGQTNNPILFFERGGGSFANIVPTPTPTVTLTPTPTLQPTETPTPTPTVTPTEPLEATPTPTPTAPPSLGCKTYNLSTIQNNPQSTVYSFTCCSTTDVVGSELDSTTANSITICAKVGTLYTGAGIVVTDMGTCSTNLSGVGCGGDFATPTPTPTPT